MARRRSRARVRAPRHRRNGSNARLTWEVDILPLVRLLDDLPDEMQRQVLVVAAERGSGLIVGAELARAARSSTTSS